MTSTHCRFLNRCYGVFRRSYLLQSSKVTNLTTLRTIYRLKSSKSTLPSSCQLNYAEDHQPDNFKQVNDEDLDEFESAEDVPETVDFQKICGGDPEKIKQLKMLQLKIDLWRQQGDPVPQCLTEPDWADLLTCVTQSSIVSLLHYYWRRETEKKHNKVLKEIKRKRYEEWKAAEAAAGGPPRSNSTEGPIIYNLVCNSLFHRIRPQQLDKLWNYRLMQAAIFAQTVLVDCTYDEYMSNKDLSLLSKQVIHMWSKNRDHFHPFHLLFCGINPATSLLLKRIRKIMPYIDNPDYPFFYTTKNYLDLYPRNQLVYLSPHSHDIFKSFSHDSVYIIGAFVDCGKDLPLSRTKAKRDNIRMLRLPVDEQVKLYNYGIKSLSLGRVVCILNDLRITNDWDFALRHISSNQRGISDEDTCAVEEDYTKSRQPVMSVTSSEDQFRRKHIYEVLLNRPKTKKSDN